MPTPMNVGIYLFENMTMLDGFAPLQVLSFVEQFKTFTFAKNDQPLKSDCGALLTPDYGFDTCPPLDILVVPGGGDVLTEMTDPQVVAFLKEVGNKAQYVTSVCSGAMILAEAGLLDGYRATTHWGWLEHLSVYSGIEVVDERVAVDRNRLTGGGITAGIDFALTLIAEAVGVGAAQVVQLVVEYRPQPPFNAGGPDTAPAEIRDTVQGMLNARNQGMVEFLAKKHAA